MAFGKIVEYFFIKIDKKKNPKKRELLKIVKKNTCFDNVEIRDVSLITR